ncbi:unnamed protein product [Lampetra planeri]
MTRPKRLPLLLLFPTTVAGRIPLGVRVNPSSCRLTKANGRKKSETEWKRLCAVNERSSPQILRLSPICHPPAPRTFLPFSSSSSSLPPTSSLAVASYLFVCRRKSDFFSFVFAQGPSARPLRFLRSQAASIVRAAGHRGFAASSMLRWMMMMGDEDDECSPHCPTSLGSSLSAHLALSFSCFPLPRRSTAVRRVRAQ